MASLTPKKTAKDSEHPTVWRVKPLKTVSLEEKEVSPPPGWCFVPAGDPGLTRRLKKAGPCWIEVHQRKNRIEALGLWTEASRVESIRQELVAERAKPSYQNKLDAARKKREEVQSEYVVEFRQAVREFLGFASRYKEQEEAFAEAVTQHAVPVGSGTVARTERIPLAQRAEAAVIAWMRHQTTAYDDMTIARVKGARREVRRQLAMRSRAILGRYRRGEDFPLESCPLARALEGSRKDTTSC